nr:reverse transcriptase domain-containing protein [Tanacetum cinerariifolium]GEY10483.1 reverse transcriptase domain-containing protein [Tanacetum cinerariifolium]
MTTLADKAILLGAGNSPPMLEKDMYDSWKSIMELYMMNIQHGRMILESVEIGPLIWPIIEENGVTRPKKYFKLSATKAIQADCDAWDRYKDLLRVYPHHGFTELHQLDTFYNALNPADQDSLKSAPGGNLLERRTQDVLTIIENKSKVHNSRNKLIVSQVKSSDANSFSSFEIAKLTHAVNQQTSAVTTAMTVILKQFQATPPLAFVKAIEKLCATCGEEDECPEETLTDSKLAEPFLRTARALIDVHREEMILQDDDERLTLNMRHDTSSYSNQHHKESDNMINIYNDSYEDYLEDLFATNHLSGNPTFSSHTDLTSPAVINLLSGNTTSSSLDHLLEEIEVNEVHIDDKLRFVEEPMEIMDREIKRLKKSRIPIIKVR